MKTEYEIIRRDDEIYAVCEIRTMEQSVNTQQIFTHEKRSECVKYLNKIKEKERKENDIKRID